MTTPSDSLPPGGSADASVPPAVSDTPPEAWKPLARLFRRAGLPLERFLRIEAASGVLLLIAAAAALVWVNSPWSASYASFWHTPLGFHVGGLAYARSLEWVVNDVLMVVFFFVVGLEIRREIHQGELSEWRRAVLPTAAALGGMIVPALIYLGVANTSATRSGWAVPMATDIAFAVGVLTLLGSRVPAALRVLLLALAVIDDLGAIVIIALFYSPGVHAIGLVFGAIGVAGIFFLQRLGVRSKLAYVAPALVLWGGVSAAGIHPTIAGVIVGLVTPVRAWLGATGFVHDVREKLDRLSSTADEELSSHELAATLREVKDAGREAMSPAESLIERLHPWVAFGIMPVFALANAGVRLSGDAMSGEATRAGAAVAIGLVVGKPLGVFVMSALALRLGVASLPRGLGYRHLVVLGCVAGIGFTMALFIAPLAFSDPALLAASKLGVLAASGTAGILALALGAVLFPRVRAAAPMEAQTADEAECSTEL